MYFANLARHSGQGLQAGPLRLAEGDEPFQVFGRGTCLWRKPEGSVRTARFKEPPGCLQLARGVLQPAAPTAVLFFQSLFRILQLGADAPKPLAPLVAAGLWRNFEIKTLSGGSLGSRVDEERSQLRELM